ncbi:lysylphosphatidylglycerol synthase transmembrane domain-containing protein [Adlercreutzia caecimuris]|uniref:lysylphosphatidylglycerol synthase transmembrane domain-containing protein n=1 Tax=Adlercreutzia caecimuris TaxID=671266 RepID=UPI001C3D0C9B|nr:lysylphosphatidylglycerol synthase transmembrane domain-containing protein [Adlercreutzia caecimuris]MCR2037185.1 flippase-like domain-containing protein [Adlercreutzia caecimuris]
MKKALLLILGIVAVCFLIGNADYLANFIDTLKTGALVPLVLSIVLMLGRHFVQAASYDAAFDAVGHATGFWHNVILIFSLVFINTFCLFSGATGVAFIIDDAHREGCDAGQSTGGAILSQIGYFAAIFVISAIGFFTMLVAGQVNFLFVTGAAVLAGTLVALSSLFFIGYRKPRVLYRFFLGLERALNRVIGLFKKALPAGWGRKTAHSFENTANILARNPKGTLITVAYASLSAILNMATLVAIGFAFGFEQAAPLVAAFAVAAISVILSPTPQGIGVVEAAIAAILTASGCSLATATAIALVYRGIMFWIPFCIGAVLLSQSGFFSSKKTATEEQKHKDIGWIAGTLVAIIGLVNIGLAFIPSSFAPYTMLTSWIDMSTVFVGGPLIIGSMLLLVLAVGLVLRFRTAWAFTVCLLVLIAGAEFLFQGTIHVGVAGILLAVWLFLKRPAFDRPFSLGSLQHYVDDALAHARKRIDGARERSQARRAATEAASEDLRRKTGWEQQAQEGLTLSKTTPDGAMLVAEDDGASGSPCPAASEDPVLCPGRAEGREG